MSIAIKFSDCEKRSRFPQKTSKILDRKMINDTHREKSLSNKAQAFTKGIFRYYGYLGNWYIKPRI